MHEIVRQRILDKANATVLSQDPGETDVELWKALWKHGIELECAWDKPGSDWRRVHKYEDNAKGVAFSHGGTRVKFRRKVK